MNHLLTAPNKYSPLNTEQAAAPRKLKVMVSDELQQFPHHQNIYYSLGKSMMMIMASFILIMTASVVAQSTIDIIKLESAVPKGAVCLDGSAPAYSYAEGFGNGSTSWIVYGLPADFRAILIEKLLKLDHSPSRGFFFHSYYRHGHFLQRGGWTCSFVYDNTLGNKSIGEAVSDWYLDRSGFEMIDAKNDIPLHSMDDDSPFLNQRCLETLVLQLKSSASHHLLSAIL